MLQGTVSIDSHCRGLHFPLCVELLDSNLNPDGVFCVARRAVEISTTEWQFICALFCTHTRHISVERFECLECLRAFNAVANNCLLYTSDAADE